MDLLHLLACLNDGPLVILCNPMDTVENIGLCISVMKVIKFHSVDYKNLST